MDEGKIGVKFMDEYYVPPEPVPEKPKKKKKLTKAEKKARKLKEAQDFKMLETRDHLRRELELSKKSVRRGLFQWEDMCKEIKTTELREELTYWMDKAQRTLQRKDEKIEMMLEEMDTINEMHQRGFSRHVQMMDYITDVFNVFVEATKQIYEDGCLQVIGEFFEECRLTDQIYTYDKRNRENIMHGSNLLFERDVNLALKIYQEKQDSRVNAEIAKRYRIRDDVIDEMKKLRKQLLSFIDTISSTELNPHKYEHINSLMERQRLFVTESQKLNDLELRNSRRQNELQRQLLAIEGDAARKIMDLKMESSYFAQVRKSIEREIQTDRNETHERLRHLASSSFEVMERYRKIEKKGELLLSLAASCRKLQTEKEKVVPWLEFHGSDEEEEETEFEKESFRLQTLNLTKHLGLSEDDLAKQAKIMKYFWRRVAQVELQNMLLREEERKLTAENEAYCERIRTMGNRSTNRDSDLLSQIQIKCVLPTKPPCPTPKPVRKPQKPKPKTSLRMSSSRGSVTKTNLTTISSRGSVASQKNIQVKPSASKDDCLCQTTELVLLPLNCPPSCHSQVNSQTSATSQRIPFKECDTPCTSKKRP